MVKFLAAVNEAEKPHKKVLEPQVSANSFVKRVFVEDHAQFSSAGIIARTPVLTGPTRCRFHRLTYLGYKQQNPQPEDAAAACTATQ